MANKVHLASSNDRLVVEAGGVVELSGGEIQGNRPPRLLPPPVGTPDGYALTSKGSAPGGADWEAGGGGGSFDPTITDPQGGDLIQYDGADWVNAPPRGARVLSVTWSPADVTQDETATDVLVLPAPCLLLGAYWQRVVPTDAGSTPTLAIGDDQGAFNLSPKALASDVTTIFGATYADQGFFGEGFDGTSASGGVSLYAPLSFTFTYVAGMTPGATTPVFKLLFVYVPTDADGTPTVLGYALSDLTDVAVADVQEGDILARVGGAWVNSGNFKIGANTDAYGVSLGDGVGTRLPLDPSNTDQVFEAWRTGLSIGQSSGADAWVIGTTGRYHIQGAAQVGQHATLWLASFLSVITSAANGEYEVIPQAIPPLSIVTLAFSTGVMLFDATLELAAGATVGWVCQVNGADTTLSDSALTIQYLGPATSL